MIHIASNNAESFLKPTPAQDQLQPNAVDLKLDKVFKTDPTCNSFTLSEENKTHRAKIEMFPDDNGYFVFDQGSSYEVAFEGTVTIGDNEAGFVINRSTLNRNGVFIASGLYDSGYSGSMAAALHNFGGTTNIKKGTRVAQFILWKAESICNYNGSYGFNNDGSIKPEEIKYHDSI